MRRTIGETTGERRVGSSRAGPEVGRLPGAVVVEAAAVSRRPKRAGAEAARFVAVRARVP
jgi:hypothetical protein